MSEYSDMVVSKGPVGFWRLDDLLGIVMTAEVGDDGTYFTGGNSFGLLSPIETDAGSRAIGGRVGTVDATGVLDPRANFTWLAWAKTNYAAPPGHVIVRNGQNGLSGGNFMLIGSQAVVRVRLVGDVADHVLASAALVDATYYMVTVTRNGAVLRLYINDTLVAEDVTLTLADINPGSNTIWEFGSAVSGTAFFASGMDEPTIFDYPISQSDVIDIYEAAINQTLLRGRSDIIVTSVLSSLLDPTPRSFPFRHNWDETLVERLSFRTAVSRAKTGAEENTGQRLVPRREFEFVQVLKNHNERRKLRAQLWANQTGHWYVPVRQDAEFVGALSSGMTSIPVTPTYRDYAVGGYIGLRQIDAQGNVAHWEEKLVTGVNGSVDCEALDYDYTNALAYPVRRAMLDTNVSLTGHSAMVESVTLTARLLPEDEPELPASATIWHPTIKYRDYEVFDPSVWQSNDWSDEREYDVERQAEEIDFGTGRFSRESDTLGATEAFTYRMTIKGRADIAALKGWFYERAGQLRYLWVPTMQADFEPLIITSSTGLMVDGTEYSDTYLLAEQRRDLAFVYNDNTMVLRRVVGFSADVNTEVLILDAAVPSLTNLRTLSFLKFCRLDADQVEFAWATDDTVRVAWRFRELAHSPEGTGVSSLSPSVSVSPSVSPSSTGSPSASTSPSVSPSGSTSPSASLSPSASGSGSASPSVSPSASGSPSGSGSPSASTSPSVSISPSSSVSPSVSPSASVSPSSSISPSVSPSGSASPST